MFEVFFGLLAVLLVGAAVLGVYEYRLYTPAQRARAPRLSTVYLVGMVLEGVAGLGILVWVATGRWPPWAFFGAAGASALLLVLVERWMLRAMERDESPLSERFSW